jgi:arginine utilization protein RocB
MNAHCGWALGLLLAVSTAAQQAAPSLEQRADQASGAECIHLSMQAARERLEDANRRFLAADVKGAHDSIDASVHYAQRMVDCALQMRKGEKNAEKNAEIDLRRLARRMTDIMRTLDSDDRPHLARSLVELDKQRDRLLHAMFGDAAGGGAGEKKP